MKKQRSYKDPNASIYLCIQLKEKRRKKGKKIPKKATTNAYALQDHFNGHIDLQGMMKREIRQQYDCQHESTVTN